MKDFPIKFSFAGQDYSARVVAYNLNTQFHISGFVPAISGLEMPYVIYKKKTNGYMWSATKIAPQEFGQAVFEAIKKSQKL